MAALTAERDTHKRAGEQLKPPVKASTIIYKGALVCIEAATGYLVPMSAATGLVVVGRAAETVDNSSGASGDLSCEVEQGVFKWTNDGTNPVAGTDFGTTCYGEDDQTVSTDSTSKSAAGTVVQVDSDGVWVKSVL